MSAQRSRAAAHEENNGVFTCRAHSRRAKIAETGGRGSERDPPLKVAKAGGLLYHGRNERTALVISEADARTAQDERAKGDRAIRPDLRMEEGWFDVHCLAFT